MIPTPSDEDLEDMRWCLKNITRETAERDIRVIAHLARNLKVLADSRKEIADSGIEIHSDEELEAIQLADSIQIEERS